MPGRGDVTLSGIRNARVVDVGVWLGGVADDLARVLVAPPKDAVPREVV
jgi:hypothetical protein